ncbi:hypothetical protein ONZ45_g2039 [Pleurotus djamor]|nr:hypothetical protein ONZ45_g2039 [Pleurotus djamor]
MPAVRTYIARPRQAARRDAILLKSPRKPTYLSRLLEALLHFFLLGLHHELTLEATSQRVHTAVAEAGEELNARANRYLQGAWYDLACRGYLLQPNEDSDFTISEGLKDIFENVRGLLDGRTFPSKLKELWCRCDLLRQKLGKNPTMTKRQLHELVIDCRRNHGNFNARAQREPTPMDIPEPEPEPEPTSPNCPRTPAPIPRLPSQYLPTPESPPRGHASGSNQPRRTPSIRQPNFTAPHPDREPEDGPPRTPLQRTNTLEPAHEIEPPTSMDVDGQDMSDEQEVDNMLQIRRLEETVATQKTTIDELEGTVRRQQSEMEEYQETISTQWRTIGERDQRIEELGGTISTHEQTIDSYSRRIGELEATVTTHEGTISGCNRLIGELEHTILAHTTRMEQDEETISTQQRTIAERGQRIGELENTVSNQSLRMVQDEETISTQRRTMDEHGQRIGELENTVSNQALRMEQDGETISNQLRTIDTQNQRIGQLETAKDQAEQMLVEEQQSHQEDRERWARTNALHLETMTQTVMASIAQCKAANDAEFQRPRPRHSL